MVSHEGVARAGEFLAASIIEARGGRASHVTIYGTDLWVETPSGRMIRVQVKTASKPSPARRSDGFEYQFLNKRTTSRHSPPDLYFLVALDLQLVLVRDRMVIGGTRLNRSCFTVEAQEESIQKHLA